MQPPALIFSSLYTIFPPPCSPACERRSVLPCHRPAAMSDLDPVLHFSLPALEAFELEFPSLEPPPPQPAGRRAHGSSQHDEERRRRRKISNRESARRSRMRKQRHLEGLRREADRLRAQNRSLTECLGAVRHNTALFLRDNARIRLDSAALLRRFEEIRRQLYTCRLFECLRQLPPPPSLAVAGSDPILASLMA